MVPECIAPNLLTLLGLFCVVIPALILMIVDPSGIEMEVPQWLCMLTGISHFVYMHFDNLDGK